MKNTQVSSKRRWRIWIGPFLFSFVTKEIILNKLRKLNPKKARQEIDIPVKIVSDFWDIVSNFFYNNFNTSLFSSNFPSYLKNANVTPIFKTNDSANVENYCPVSILPNLSKVYERCVYIQIYKYLNKILSKWQSLCEKCSYLEFFWSVFSSNAGKYWPEKLRICALFTQWMWLSPRLYYTEMPSCYGRKMETVPR